MRNMYQILFLALVGSCFSSGCVYSHRKAMHEPVVAVPANPVIVTEAPPAPRNEVVGVAPAEDQVWLPGYWMRSDQRWVWVPGHWETRPRTSATWIPGVWTKSTADRGWVWIPGHWE